MVETSHLQVEYRGKRALHDVSMQFGPGFTAVIGPSGAGKSTLMRALNRLIPATLGQVLLDGQPLGRPGSALLWTQQQQLGMVFQQFNLVRRLSALENVLLGCLGRSGVRVHDQHAQDLHVTSLQADERHGFVGRKDQPCWEATVIGPCSKFIVQNALGARTTDLAMRLLFGARSRLHDPHGVVLFKGGWLQGQPTSLQNASTGCQMQRVLPTLELRSASKTAFSFDHSQ